MMKNNLLMPKASYFYRNNIATQHPTPSGSHLCSASYFYKHQIPSGLENKKNNRKTNPKDSNVYRMSAIYQIATLKGSHVYRKIGREEHPTPSGSHFFPFLFSINIQSLRDFFKTLIPIESDGE